MFATNALLLGQQSHHLAQMDPLFDATNLPVLGLRVIGRYTMVNMHTLLPRVGQERLLRHFGEIDIDHAAVHLDDLPDAAAAAVGLGDLRCKTPATVTARSAAIVAAAPLGGTTAIGHALGLSPATIRRLRRVTVDLRAVHAVRGQLRLRGALRASEPQASLAGRI